MDTITANKRDFTKKAKLLRKEGFVPGSVYGGPLKEAIALQLSENDVTKLLRSKMVGSRATLVLDGKNIPVQIKDVDRKSISNKLLCIDFQALKADQKINSVMHIVLENADKVPAIVELLLTEINYTALPADMLDIIKIDVADMPVGTVITVGDIPELQTDKLELQVNKDELVVRIVEKEIIVEEEEEETAEAAPA